MATTEKAEAAAAPAEAAKGKTDESMLQDRVDAIDRVALADKYALEAVLGEGTYGIVLRAHSVVTGAPFAIKKLRLDGLTEGVPATTIREVTLLHELSEHANVVRLLDVVCAQHRVYLVFELLDENLRQFIKQRVVSANMSLRNTPDGSIVPLSVVKDIMRQLVHALYACHQRRILHRDLKPDNVLMTTHTDPATGETRCCVKLADFGLARTFELSLQTYTNEVMTLWYRAPEILLGQMHYTTSADIWSLGCIMVEMVVGCSLFRGHDRRSQLDKIFYALGTPTEETWPGVSKLLQSLPAFKLYRVAPLPSRLPDCNEQAAEFMAFLLQTNPQARPTLAQILQHPFLASP